MTKYAKSETIVRWQITRGFQIWSQKFRARSVAPAKVWRAPEFLRRFSHTRRAFFSAEVNGFTILNGGNANGDIFGPTPTHGGFLVHPPEDWPWTDLADSRSARLTLDLLLGPVRCVGVRWSWF